MKKLLLFIILLGCISCNSYGEHGDGNGNLKHEMLVKKCEEKQDYVTWLFLRPETKTVCHYYYNGKKFSGTTAVYHENENLASIFTFSEGIEIAFDRKEYDANGVLIESGYEYEFD